MFCVVTIVRVPVLYCDSGTCTCCVLWLGYVYNVLYRDNCMCTCSVLWQWNVYMLCFVIGIRVQCFVSWQLYVYMFCIVTVVRVHVVFWDSCKRTCFALWQWYARRKVWKALIKRLEGTRIGKDVVQSETVNSGGREWKISSQSSPCFNAPINTHPSILLRLFVSRPLPIYTTFYSALSSFQFNCFWLVYLHLSTFLYCLQTPRWPTYQWTKKNGTEINNRSNNFNGSSMYMSVLTWLCETKSNSQWQRLWQARNCKYIIRGKPNNYETGWKAETTTNNTAHGLTTITPTCIKLARQKP